MFDVLVSLWEIDWVLFSIPLYGKFFHETYWLDLKYTAETFWFQIAGVYCSVMRERVGKHIHLEIYKCVFLYILNWHYRIIYNK